MEVVSKTVYEDEDMGAAPPPRVLPEGAPADAVPVTEDQLERLPEYAQHLIHQFMEQQKIGAPMHRTTREELEHIRASFFAAAPAALPAETTPTSNSTAHAEEEKGMDFD
jgi:hypothetical protein